MIDFSKICRCRDRILSLYFSKGNEQFGLPPLSDVGPTGRFGQWSQGPSSLWKIELFQIFNSYICVSKQMLTSWERETLSTYLKEKLEPSIPRKKNKLDLRLFLSLNATPIDRRILKTR